MKRQILYVVGAVAAALLVVGVYMARKSSAEDHVTIGAVLLLSGDNALWGENARKAIELVTSEINADGGIHGKPLRVVYEDSRGNPTTAVSAFRKLTSVDRVPIVLGDMLSSTTLAMAPLANQNEIVLVGISSSAPAVTAAGPFVYRVWPSDLYEGRVFADHVYDQGVRRVGIVFQNNEYGTGLKDAFRNQFQARGGSVPFIDSYTTNDREFRALAAKVRSAGLDAVYIVGYYEDTGMVIRDFRQSGVTAKLLGTSSAVHEKLVEIAGTGAEGFRAAVVNDFDTDALTARQQAFADSFRTHYGAEPDWAATHAADALLVAAECLRSDHNSGAAVRDCIEQRRTFEGVNLGISFDNDGDVINKPIAVREVRGGKFVTIWKQGGTNAESHGVANGQQ